MASKSSVLLAILVIAQLLFTPSPLVVAVREPGTTKEGYNLKQLPALEAVLGQAIPDQCVPCIPGRYCCNRSFPTCCGHGTLCCRVAFSCCGSRCC